MKKLLGLLLILLSLNRLEAQLDAKEDSFKFRNDIGLDYNLYVKNNDSHQFNHKTKIYIVSKQGVTANNYTLELIDSSYIRITDTFKSSYSGQFVYFSFDTAGKFDTAIVKFDRIFLPAEVYPGDANKDNIVNHLDIFPLGLMFERYGESRHNLDTNISYTPKRVGNWFYQAGGINAKFADVDGNSIVNSVDMDKLKLNLGRSQGVPVSTFSPTIGLASLKVESLDTIIFKGDTGKIRIPILINSPTAISSYGLGYSYNVQNQDRFSLLDTVYSKHTYSRDSIWLDATNILFIEDKISKTDRSNIAYCRTSRRNGDMGGPVGVVEIVVEDILIGLRENETARIKLNITDVAMIDENYTYLPIKPVSKTIYLRKDASAGIPTNNLNEIQVYPTLVQDYVIIDKLNSKSVSYVITNVMGQTIASGHLIHQKTMIQNLNWTSGIYFLKIEGNASVFKIQKN